MTPAELSRTVLRSVRGAVEEQELSVAVPARIVVQPPPRPGCGDYASNVALQLAQQAGRPAREVAEILRKRLSGSAGIARVEIAGPGFLNFTLGDGAQVALVREVLARGDGYGGGPAAGRSPVTTAPATGPATAPSAHPMTAPASNARATVVAEALARIDAAAGLGGRRVADGQPVLVPAPYDLAALIARLGVDEARWVLLRPAAQDPVRVPERTVQRESNPRFRVQYAYARARALGRHARDLGFGSEPGDVGAPVRGQVADDGSSDGAGSAAQALKSFHTLLATYPSVVESAARLRAPDRVVRHLEATADAFFRWHDVYPPLPVGEQKPLAVHRARLALAEAGRTVLANGLRLLGISAPEHL
ncbi:DALR anticodon-binding domain-containing protein [Streptomyces sp. P9-2B-2]|uniref:ArgS-related anticodon-binding protein NrtL n=1 Tax=Streptomyces TaxID=1883 RepID=UPI002258AE01|nr:MULTISPECIES: DALR anticodon-binding domain-containing protein [Streptomyces]MCX4636196.1 DALR anticodon-binding domain-containing protein [Streptomyces platensis]WJY40683.1 DALR anticodon-binding domain-containing protein [Streptomyces sp. P9-2B-2]